MPRPLIMIMGPTALGKTALAMRLQDALGGVERVSLISVDSALVYRGMDIGTAKPDPDELAAYPHALIDIRDPADPYTAADFVVDADAAVHSAWQRGQLPILVGGTMLYFRRFSAGIAERRIKRSGHSSKPSTEHAGGVRCMPSLRTWTPMQRPIFIPTIASAC